jgi:LuxR family quorum sensing-dependent transcriptional regulator
MLVEFTSDPAIADLQQRLWDYTERVEQARSADEVLDALHALATARLPLSVLAAAKFPLKSGDWDAIKLGKTIFIHRDVPAGWWEEYHLLAGGRFRPLLFLARSSISSHTWTEARRMFEPVGVDRWSYELALKYGMRDGLTCSVASRWVVTFWSRKELSKILTPPVRIMVFAAASFAALRLEQLVGLNSDWMGTRNRLTPRELAVLRLAAAGAQSNEVARALGLGEETVRSHLKKAQTKLGARNHTQAVAEALRQNLIP